MTITYLFLDENRLLPEVLAAALAPHGLSLTENDPDTGRYMITGPAAPTEWRPCENETEPDGCGHNSGHRGRRPEMSEPTPDGVDAELARYLADRDHTRANRTAARLARLTDRERQLLREAAVMGYVHGWMDGQVNGRPGTPISLSDSQIVATVVIECANHSDRYPLIGEHQADDDSNERPDMEER